MMISSDESRGLDQGWERVEICCLTEQSCQYIIRPCTANPLANIGHFHGSWLELIQQVKLIRRSHII